MQKKINPISASADSKPSCIDLKTINNLRDLLKDKFELIANKYIDGAESLMRKIKNAIEETDIDRLVRSSHTLKSSSQQMGANGLARVGVVAK